MYTHLLAEDIALPVVVETNPDDGAADAARLLAWATDNRAWIEDTLLQHGGVLVRGFAVTGAADLQRFCDLFGRERRRYVGGDSPRTSVGDGIYTSTEYPSHLEIPMHNEMSYASQWPEKIFFLCVQAAAEGGETPIGDSRRILEAIDPEVRQRFVDRQVRYVRNLHGGWGLGKSWQQTFETSDRSAVEQHCRNAGIECEWRDDSLRVSQCRPAITTHPRTGEQVWFNQADLWHVSSLGPRKAASMLKMMAEEDLPQHAYFGDGSPIEPADVEAVRGAYRQVEVKFPWVPGDLLVLDNVLVAHGRKPFKGERTILAALT